MKLFFSTFRLLCVSALIILLLKFENNPEKAVWYGILAGYFIADFTTWFIKSIIDFRDNLRESSWESIVMFGAAIVSFYVYKFKIPAASDAYAISYLVCLLTFTVKISYYLIDEMIIGHQEDGDI